MRPLRTKDDVLDYAANHAPSAACTRAIRDGRATVESWRDGDNARPGWKVVVQSPRKRVWTIVILCNEAARTYEVEWI